MLIISFQYNTELCLIISTYIHPSPTNKLICKEEKYHTAPMKTLWEQSLISDHNYS